MVVFWPPFSAISTYEWWQIFDQLFLLWITVKSEPNLVKIIRDFWNNDYTRHTCTSLSLVQVWYGSV